MAYAVLDNDFPFLFHLLVCIKQPPGVPCQYHFLCVQMGVKTGSKGLPCQDLLCASVPSFLPVFCPLSCHPSMTTSLQALLQALEAVKKGFYGAETGLRPTFSPPCYYLLLSPHLSSSKPRGKQGQVEISTSSPKLQNPSLQWL